MDSFKVIITIKNNILKGKLYDINFDDEYTIFRNINASGYSLQVKDQYIELLNDIKEKTIDKRDFIFDQTNRVVDYVSKKYNESCDYPWKDDTYSKAAVIRNKSNRKWYGLIMPITFDKLGENSNNKIEINNCWWWTDQIFKDNEMINAELRGSYLIYKKLSIDDKPEYCDHKQYKTISILYNGFDFEKFDYILKCVW